MIVKLFRFLISAAMCAAVMVSCGDNETSGNQPDASVSDSGKNAEKNDASEDLDTSEIPDGSSYKCTEYLVSSDQESCTMITYCDDKGNELRYIFYPDSEMMPTDDMEYEYDSNGRLAYSREKAADGDITKYEYYDNGEVKHMSINPDSDQPITFDFEYEYDDLGRAVTATEYHNGSKEPFSTTYRTYDENGNKITEKFQYSNDLVLESTYEYDKKGRVIVKSIDDNSYYRYEYEDYD